jgi:isoquinoline 1-oxidoreductase subunit alpha
LSLYRATGRLYDAPLVDSMPEQEATMNLTINGITRSVDVPGDMPLLWVLRDTLNLTGTKFGCGMAQCGACTVHVDGEPVRACVVQASSVVGKKVTTIEGLAPKGDHALQRAWIAEQAPQCGYCQSGQIMQAAALLAKNRTPSRAQITEHMAGNICRCGTYNQIIAAIERAAKTA